MAPQRRSVGGFLRGYLTERHVFDEAVQQERADEAGDAPPPGMRRCLTLLDLTCYGVAAIIGAGIFIVTGIQARENAGPSVIVSYLISGGVAMILALVYGEFASGVSVTGGTFVYVTELFGRGVGWFVAVCVLLEYGLAGATVAVGFAHYLAALCGFDGTRFDVAVPGTSWTISPVGAALVVVISLALLLRVRESFWINNGITCLTVTAIFITIIAGATKVNPANYSPFLHPKRGFAGTISAAAAVVFAYIGFDMVSQGAEEAVNPGRDVPLAIIISTAICTLLYAGASTVVVGLRPFSQIGAAPFADVFRATPGYGWVAYVVSAAATLETLNTVFACLYACQRVVVILGRARLLPYWLSTINGRTHTPVIACLVVGAISMVVALLVPLQVLADTVSLGTLWAFSIVALGIAWRARFDPATTPARTAALRGALPGVMIAAAGLTAGAVYANVPEARQSRIWPVYLVCGLMWVAAVAVLQATPMIWRPNSFRMPLNPWLPCFGAGCSLFLAGSLSSTTWWVWGCAQAIGFIFFGINTTLAYRRGYEPGTLAAAPAKPAEAAAKDVSAGTNSAGGTQEQ